VGTLFIIYFKFNKGIKMIVCNGPLKNKCLYSKYCHEEDEHICTHENHCEYKMKVKDRFTQIIHKECGLPVELCTCKGKRLEPLSKVHVDYKKNTINYKNMEITFDLLDMIVDLSKIPGAIMKLECEKKGEIYANFEEEE
jgi:hypothetical protein